MTYTRKDLQDQLLSILVLDFGYGSTHWGPPTHGHDPLRHQFAWRMATEGRDPAELATRLQRLRDYTDDEFADDELIEKMRERIRTRTGPTT